MTSAFPTAGRFDEHVRSERYFTATLLPAILLHDNFAGLRQFLALVDERAPEPHDAAGNTVERQPVGDLTPETVELITEFHIARDLEFAGLLPRVDRFGAADADPDMPSRRDAPDLVLDVGSELLDVKGKFYGPCEVCTLNAQLLSHQP